MAIVKMKFNCGCGFGGNTVEEAIAHADASGHTITNIAGSIAPTNKRVHVAKPSYSPKDSRPAYIPERRGPPVRTFVPEPIIAPPPAPAPAIVAQFGSMRDRLMRTKK